MDPFVELQAENATLKAAVLKWQTHANALGNALETRRLETAKALRQHDGCDHALALANDLIALLRARIENCPHCTPKKDP